MGPQEKEKRKRFSVRAIQPCVRVLTCTEVLHAQQLCTATVQFRSPTSDLVHSIDIFRVLHCTTYSSNAVAEYRGQFLSHALLDADAEHERPP